MCHFGQFIWLQFVTPFVWQHEAEVIPAFCLQVWESRKRSLPCPAVAPVQAELPRLPAAAGASDHHDTEPCLSVRAVGDHNSL